MVSLPVLYAASAALNGAIAGAVGMKFKCDLNAL
jgi:hypothetical protein